MTRRASVPSAAPSPTAVRPRAALSDTLPTWAGVGIVSVVLLVTLSFLFVWRYGYTCDHVISGLMAKSILHRGERPLFLWALGYNGILLESYAVALLFALFGEGPKVYYLFTLLCFWALTYGLYRHLSARIGTRAAAFTSLFFVVSSPRVFYYVMRPQPNYTEIFLLGLCLMQLVAMLVRAVWLEQRGADSKVLKLSAGCGFVLGFGLYTYQLILFFIGATGLWLLAPYVADARTRAQRVAPSMHAAWRLLVGLALAGGVLLGMSVILFFALGQGPAGLAWAENLFKVGAMSIALGVSGEFLLSRSDTVRAHLKSVAAFGGAALLGYAPSLYFTYVLHGFSRDRLRVALNPAQVIKNFGLFVEAQRRFLNAWDQPLSAVVGLIVVACGVGLLLLAVYKLWGVARHRRAPGDLFETTPLSLLPLVTIPLFCCAAAAEDWESARWTIGLSLFFAAAQGTALASGLRRGGAAAALAVGLAVMVLGHNATSLYGALASAEAKQFYAEELITPLREKNITRAYATYWHAYSINFITNEEIIIEPVFNNYCPHYAKEVAGAPRIAYIDSMSPRLTQFPSQVQVGEYQYEKVDSWFGTTAGFVVLQRR